MGTVNPKPKGLFSGTRTAVFHLLLLRPDERFHLREIARQTGSGLGALQRELAQLVEMGIIKREDVGNQSHYQADRDCPVFEELKSLILKTTGVVGVLRRWLEPVSSRVRLAVVYGSMASGQMHVQSDVDILILSDDLTMRELGGAIRQAGRELKREINVNLYRPAQWASRVREGHPLARSVVSKPVLRILGDIDELDSMA